MRRSIGYMLWVTVIIIVPFIPMLTWSIAQTDLPQASITVLPHYSDPQTRVIQSQLKTHLPASNIFPSDTSDTESSQIGASPIHTIPAILSRNGMQLPLRTFFNGYGWTLFLFVYSLVFMLFLVWDIAGRMYVRYWLSQSREVTAPRLCAIFQNAKHYLGLTNEVLFYESRVVPAPVSVGITRPIVILPPAILHSLTDKELTAVIIHELSHIKRHDTLIFPVIYFLKAFFFFHPLVWMISRRIEYLAELTADTEAIAYCNDAVFYAKMLTRMKTLIGCRIHSTSQAPGIMARKSIFYQRIDSILSQNNHTARRVSVASLALTVSILSFSVVAALSFPLDDTVGNIEPVRISGRAVYKEQPVSGAVIYVSSFGAKSVQKVAITRVDGTFECKIDRSSLVLPRTKMPALIAYKHEYAVGWALLPALPDAEDIILQLIQPASVTGTVKDTNGNPLKGVSVNVNGLFAPQYERATDAGHKVLENRCILPDHAVYTDDAGRFTLTNIPAGMDIGISFSKKGYADLNRQFVPAGMTGMSVILNRGGTLEGHVQYENSGKAAKNISLTVKRIKTYHTGIDNAFEADDLSGGHGTYLRPAEHLTTIQPDKNNYITETTTNLAGNYKVDNLPPGRYAVFLKEQLPGWTSIAKTDIMVSQNQTTKAGSMVLVRGGLVTGRMYDKQTNQPLPGHIIRYTDTSHPSPRNNTFEHAHIIYTDDDGYFCFRAAPGDVTFSTTGSDGYEIQYFTKTLDRKETVAYQNIFLDHGMTVSGKVIFDGIFNSEPIGGLCVNIPHDRLLHGGYAGLNDFVATDANGRFTIPGLKECESVELHVFNTLLSIDETVMFDVKNYTNTNDANESQTSPERRVRYW